MALVRDELAALEPRSYPREFARRRAFVRWPVHGNVLEAFAEGRLEVGEHTLLEPHVWLTAPDDARIRIGSGTFLNIGVMVAAVDLVEIGDHCMFANGCFVTDGNHRFDDPDRPVPWQGFSSKGPTRVEDNVWCGANVVITSGVTVGERSRDRRQQRRHGGHPAVLPGGGSARSHSAPDRVSGADQHMTIRWNGRSASLPLFPFSVRTATPFTCDASELTLIWLFCGGAAALASPTVAK